MLLLCLKRDPQRHHTLQRSQQAARLSRVWVQACYPGAAAAAAAAGGAGGAAGGAGGAGAGCAGAAGAGCAGAAAAGDDTAALVAVAAAVVGFVAAAAAVAGPVAVVAFVAAVPPLGMRAAGWEGGVTSEKKVEGANMEVGMNDLEAGKIGEGEGEGERTD